MTDEPNKVCPNGHAVAPGSDYCTVCGAATVAPGAAVAPAAAADAPATAEAPAAPPAPVAPEPPSGRSRLLMIGAVVVVLVLVAGVLGAVLIANRGNDSGGGDGTKSASQSAFCSGLQGFQDGFADIDPTVDTKSYVAKLKQAGKTLQTTGVPSNMPADARAGFALTIKEINALPNDATLDDLSKLGSDVTDADQKNLDALNSYINKECPDLDTTG